MKAPLTVHSISTRLESFNFVRFFFWLRLFKAAVFCFFLLNKLAAKSTEVTCKDDTMHEEVQFLLRSLYTILQFNHIAPGFGFELLLQCSNHFVVTQRPSAGGSYFLGKKLILVG